MGAFDTLGGLGSVFFVTLMGQCATVFLLLMPFPSFLGGSKLRDTICRMLTKILDIHPVVNYVVVSVILVSGAMFYGSMNALGQIREAAKTHTGEDGNAGMVRRLAVCKSERDAYITGAVLIMTVLIYRLHAQIRLLNESRARMHAAEAALAPAAPTFNAAPPAEQGLHRD